MAADDQNKSSSPKSGRQSHSFTDGPERSENRAKYSILCELNLEVLLNITKTVGQVTKCSNGMLGRVMVSLTDLKGVRIGLNINVAFHVTKFRNMRNA